MEKDLNTIKKLAEQKEEENFKFRNFLKGCDHHEVDRVVHQLYEKYSKKIDCKKCGNCCRKLIPVLSIEEINNIAEHLKISFERFEKKYVERETAGGIILKGQGCPFLNENKCLIYEYRPEPCRFYPHLHKNNINHRLLNIIDNSFICPIVYNVLEEVKTIFKN